MADIEVIEAADDAEACTWAVEIRKHRRTVLVHVGGRNAGWEGYREGVLVGGGLNRGPAEAAITGTVGKYLREQAR